MEKEKGEGRGREKGKGRKDEEAKGIKGEIGRGRDSSSSSTHGKSQRGSYEIMECCRQAYLYSR